MIGSQTENQSCMSSLLRILMISWKNFLSGLCQLGTQARFSTICATCFQAHLATTGRVLAMAGQCQPPGLANPFQKLIENVALSAK